jgi:hypothetical protein
MRKSHKRYGFMNGLDSMLEVTKIDGAVAVAGDTPGRGAAKR